MKLGNFIITKIEYLQGFPYSVVFFSMTGYNIFENSRSGGIIKKGFILVRNKRYIAGITALAVALFATGCSSKKVKTHYTEHFNGTLYVEQDSKNEAFSNITNNITKSGFELDTYKPVNLMTSKGNVGFRGIVLNDLPSVPYYYYRCSANPLLLIPGNIIWGVTTLGVSLAMGGICEKDIIFDSEEFDSGAKAWVSENQIDRDAIFSEYDGLLKTKNEQEAIYRAAVADINNRYSHLYNQYKKAYAQRPKVVEKYVDTSGLYNNEKELATISFSEEILPKQFMGADANFMPVVNQAFPCDKTESCLSNINSAQHALKELTSSELKKIAAVNATKIPEYEKSLQKKSSYLTVSVKSNDRKTIHDKTLHYRVKAPSQVDTNSSALNVEYEILYADYDNVFPYFEETNKDVKVTFTGNRKSLTIQNLTNAYVQLNSIHMYYGRGVNEITSSQKGNYASELAPKSKMTYRIYEEDEKKDILPGSNIDLQLYYTIKDADYKKITKELAQKTNFDFGFAIKYTLADSVKNRTLYAVDKVNLYKEISHK